MRYWLVKFIYYLRRCLPLFASDQSKIFTAYSTQVLNRLSYSNISAEDRIHIFFDFSKNFMSDISGERLAEALIKTGEPDKWVTEFEFLADKKKDPRAKTLLRETKSALKRKHSLPFEGLNQIDFNWTKTHEEQFTKRADSASHKLPILPNLVFWLYRVWRILFRTKNIPVLGNYCRQEFLKHLSSDNISDEDWLQTFEKYSAIFTSPTDIFLMAENLKFRDPARDLALLEFSYRVRYKKPKALLFYRRVKIVLTSTVTEKPPEYRGTELAMLFYNPVETERALRREKIKAEQEKATEERLIKREEDQAKLKIAAEQRGEKIVSERKKRNERLAKRNTRSRDRKAIAAKRRREKATSKIRKRNERIAKQNAKERAKKTAAALERREKAIAQRKKHKQLLSERNERLAKLTTKARAKKSAAAKLRREKVITQRKKRKQLLTERNERLGKLNIKARAKKSAAAKLRREKIIAKRKKRNERLVKRNERVAKRNTEVRAKKITAAKLRQEKIVAERKSRNESLIEQNAKVRAKKTLAAKLRGEKILLERRNRTNAIVKRNEKLKSQRLKSDSISLKKSAKWWDGEFGPIRFVSITFDKALRKLRGEEDGAVQLISDSTDQLFHYIPADRKFLRSDPSLAILSFTGRYDLLQDFSMLREYSRIVILNSSSLTDIDLKENIQDHLDFDIDVECFSPARLLIKPYTQDHQIVSDFSDQLAKSLMTRACNHRELVRYFDPYLTEEYELSLSDNIFRTVERFYALNLFFETIASTTPVFLNSAHDNFRFSLAHSGFSQIVILEGRSLLEKTRQWSPEYPQLHPRKWVSKLRASFKQINADTLKALEANTPAKTNNIMIATHSRSSVHGQSAQKIRETITRDYDVQTLDFSPTAIAPDDTVNFYSITQSLDRKSKTSIQSSLTPVIYETLSSLPLPKGVSQELTPDIAGIMARTSGLLLAQTSLFRAIKNQYAPCTRSAAILVPGRYALTRTIARAFHALNLPTIDIQLLFLSTMARYKAPMTKYQTVIDTSARDLYVKHYGVDKETISIIGSIMRDEDTQRAQKFGRAASLEHFNLEQNRHVITLACQPGFEGATQGAVRILTKYLKASNNISVVVKLHPAQSETYREKIEDMFEQRLPSDMKPFWRVIHQDPFWKLIPSTDVLISYFSNVCLQACAFGIPILSLPGGGPRPDSDFEAIGLARNVKSLNDLTSDLDNLLSMPESKRLKEHPYRYLQDNPHMYDANSLSRLQEHIGALLKP